MANSIRTKRPAQKGRVAVVTGGGTGLGRATAERLEDDGFYVAVIGRRPDKLKAGRRKRLYSFPCDVADEKQVKATVQAILQQLGRIDVLFNCAGVFRELPIDKTTPAQVSHLVGINLVGTINMTVACVAALKGTKGTIINMSSALAARPYSGISLYCAAKGGIEAYTRACASELGHYGVRVNAVSPGMVRSEIFAAEGWSQAMLERELKRWGKTYALGRAGEPEDIAGAVSFLASKDAAWITGIVLQIEGGKLVI